MENNKDYTSPVKKGDVVIKKKPFTQKLKEAFISQDFRTAADGVNKNVIIPAVKKVIADSIANVVNNILFGTNYTNGNGIRINSSNWTWNGVTYNGQNVNYSGYSKPVSQPAYSSLPSNLRYDQIEVQPNPAENETMMDAERKADEIIMTLRDILDRYQKVYIADVMEVCKLPTQSTQWNYGWTNLRDLDKIYTGTGFLLRFPNPTVLR